MVCRAMNRRLSVAGFGLRFDLAPALLMGLLLLARPTAGAGSEELREVTEEGEKAILLHPGIEVAGARDADVTIVEYFDYNCPFCKRIAPTFAQLIAADRKLAILYKDWPVLGDGSVYAARCALASKWQGKYLAAHDALLAASRINQNDQVELILRNAGIDVDRLKRDLVTHSKEIAAQLARHDSEARALELDGTPGIIIGRQLIPGVADIKYFQQLIAEARQNH